MKIALIGYGKMGHIIEQIAVQRGHAIVATIDIDNTDEFGSDAFRSAEVAIEFTTPATAFDNYLRCFEADVPVVSGTTGWTARIDEVKRLCEQEGKTFFYASNFSVGVNIFFALNSYLARLMNRFPAYDAGMTEIHHIHKLDAPSGTAITVAEGIVQGLDRKTQWRLQEAGEQTAAPDEVVHIQALREGEVPGIHEVRYESEVDVITIRHDAKSRAGFALGAVLAAEYTAGKKGFLGMQDMLNISNF
ncbi:MAG: 4-hydroxy-tetrahydrodipicolinate reductase [Tannerella sp.]|jgi:4-hydroxy-tetrahydrodipicolinate reductase|nr:4-hydroxy-tetrahydrodipicolinate reductase [Tannerella sp.]